MEEENVVSLEQMLGNEIADLIDKLAEVEPGSKEHTAIVKDISELYQSLTKGVECGYKVEEANAHLEAEKERYEKEREAQTKKDEAEAAKAKKEAFWDKVFKGIDVGVKVLGIVLPLGLYAAWLDKGFEFEEKGSFTSSTFRGFFGKLKPTKVD